MPLWVKPAAGVAAVIVLIVAVLWYRGDVWSDGKKAGKIETEHQVQQNTIVIERKIQRAEQAAPRTRRAVADRLRSDEPF